ncbi:MAG: hypothetical protein KF773_23420 [Deltaproteobacteria bacterium]|nr:hypothetical protein [Deltaproteobacteria bacterium]
MPRNRAPSTPILAAAAAALLGGCFFDADYGQGAKITCTDGRCPDGLACNPDRTCGPPGDGPPPDTADLDAPAARLTCADPGILPATGATVTGSTSDRMTNSAATCGGFVMNGRDAVYRIDLATSPQLTISLTGERKAYLVTTCGAGTPTCVGNAFATASAPLTISPGAGSTFIVVDDENPLGAGPYTLTVTVN